MNPWFRFYREVLHDPKVQLLTPHAFKFWVNCLCLGCENNGYLPAMEAVSFAFHMSESQVAELTEVLVNVGLLETRRGELYLHNWHKRQYKADISTERVKRFRKRHETVSTDVSETPPDTDTEQTQIQSRTEERIPLSANADFEGFWSGSTKRGSKKEALIAYRQIPVSDRPAILAGMAAWQKSDQWQDETKQPHICRWLRRRGWEEIVPKSRRASANGNGNEEHARKQFEEIYGRPPVS